jgi:hypothetical protein
VTQPIDLALLKKLAAVCRKSGIKSFSGGGIEFTLGEAPQPVKRSNQPKAKKKTVLQTPDGDIETDTPSDMDLLFWSAPDVQEESSA